MQVADLASAQAAAGHEVSVITSTPAAGDHPAAPVTVRRVTHGRQHRVPRHVFAPGAGVRALLDGDFDVIHAHAGGWSPLAFAGAWVGPPHGVPTVVTLHSLLSWEKPLYRSIDRVTGWRRRQVAWTAVSEVAATGLRDLLLPGTAVAVLPNGVDVAGWAVRPQPRDPGDVLAVAVMRLAPRKRPLQLLAIIRRVRELIPATVRFRTVIVGEGSQRERMERYVQRHRMRAYVELRGRLSRDQIRELYSAADLFVAPARLESFGIAALEARCAGLPVVAMAASGIRDLIQDGRDGVLVDTDRQMAEAIARLASSPATRSRIARNNSLSAPPFDWARTVERTQREYERAARILDHPGRGEPSPPVADQPPVRTRSGSRA